MANFTVDVSSATNSAHILKLPTELFALIFRQLHFLELLSVRRTCKGLQANAEYVLSRYRHNLAPWKYCKDAYMDNVRSKSKSKSTSNLTKKPSCMTHHLFCKQMFVNMANFNDVRTGSSSSSTHKVDRGTLNQPFSMHFTTINSSGDASAKPLQVRVKISSNATNVQGGSSVIGYTCTFNQTPTIKDVLCKIQYLLLFSARQVDQRDPTYLTDKQRARIFRSGVLGRKESNEQQEFTPSFIKIEQVQVEEAVDAEKGCDVVLLVTPGTNDEDAASFWRKCGLKWVLSEQEEVVV